MAKSKYDWTAFDVALQIARQELFQAQRHRNSGKRVNILNDLDALSHAIDAAKRALNPREDK